MTDRRHLSGLVGAAAIGGAGIRRGTVSFTTTSPATRRGTGWHAKYGGNDGRDELLLLSKAAAQGEAIR
jgi:hypothetical protein